MTQSEVLEDEEFYGTAALVGTLAFFHLGTEREHTVEFCQT